MVAPVDIATGKINYPALDKNGNTYEYHPMTKEKIVGATIPMIEEVKKLCIDAKLSQKSAMLLGMSVWDLPSLA